MDKLLAEIRNAEVVTRDHIQRFLAAIANTAPTKAEKRAGIQKHLGPFLQKRVRGKLLLDLVLADLESYPEYRGDD